jgi:hypothetical protein
LQPGRPFHLNASVLLDQLLESLFTSPIFKGN